MVLVGFVAVVIALDSTPLLSKDAAVVVDDSAQLAAGLFAAVACWWTARRHTGSQKCQRKHCHRTDHWRTSHECLASAG